MITNPITEVNDAMQETSPVLSAFDHFNPDAVFKHDKSRKEFFNTLNDHYGQPKTDRFENDTVTGIPIIVFKQLSNMMILWKNLIRLSQR